MKTIILASLFLLASACNCFAQGVGKAGPSQPNGPVGPKNVPNKLPPRPAQPLPDLVYQGWTAQGYMLAIEVRNDGIVETKSFVVETTVTDEKTGYQETSTATYSGVGPKGQSKAATFFYKMNVKNLKVFVRIDSKNQIKESNERNNTKTFIAGP